MKLWVTTIAFYILHLINILLFRSSKTTGVLSVSKNGPFSESENDPLAPFVMIKTQFQISTH